MTFREAARRLRQSAAEARVIAAQLEAGQGELGWAIGRDVIAQAATFDRYAAVADKAADDIGEPSAEDLAWIATAAPGELVEVFGR